MGLYTPLTYILSPQSIIKHSSRNKYLSVWEEGSAPGTTTDKLPSELYVCTFQRLCIYNNKCIMYMYKIEKGFLYNCKAFNNNIVYSENMGAIYVLPACIFALFYDHIMYLTLHIGCMHTQGIESS